MLGKKQAAKRVFSKEAFSLERWEEGFLWKNFRSRILKDE